MLVADNFTIGRIGRVSIPPFSVRMFCRVEIFTPVKSDGVAAAKAAAAPAASPSSINVGSARNELNPTWLELRQQITARFRTWDESGNRHPKGIW